MDYYEVGQRIRKIRKARCMSQEQLAEKVDASTTHISHIENANTKMSLSIFVKIAETLEVQTDALLYDVPRDTTNRAMSDVADVFERCTANEARVLAEIVKTAKQSFDAYL